MAALTDAVAPAFIRAFQESTITRPVNPAFFAGALRESGKLTAHAWKGAVAALIEEDSSAALAGASMPALVLWGDHDTFADAKSQKRLLRLLPKAEHRTFAGYGHALHWEAPAAVAAVLRDFVMRLAQ